MTDRYRHLLDGHEDEAAQRMDEYLVRRASGAHVGTSTDATGPVTEAKTTSTRKTPQRAVSRKFDLRCSEEEVARWESAAQAEGVTTSEFLRLAADERAAQLVS